MNTPKEYTEIEQGLRSTEHYESSSVHTHNPSPVEDDEIDLLELFQQVWQERKIVIYTIIGALVIGLFVAIASPEEYSTEIVLMPQTNSESGGQTNLLKQIGGFAGVSLGEASGTLDKNLYPDITQSTPFYLSLMEKEVYFPTLDTTMTLYHYFTEVKIPPVTEHIKRYTLGLPRMLINLPLRLVAIFKNPDPNLAQNIDANTPVVDTLREDTTFSLANQMYQPIKLNSKQLSVAAKLKERVTTSIETNGMVRVEAEMPDPLASAYITEAAVEYLTSYVKDYRIEKLQANVLFIEQQYEEKKARYNQAQQRLAGLRDRNANIVTERGRINLERAQNEYNLAFNLYQSVAQQLEQAKIKVQEETPVFKVLEPIQIPLKQSKPNRELIVILSIFAGIMVGFAIIFFRILYRNLKSKMQWSTNN